VAATESDKKLRKLLAGVVTRMTKYGTRSNELKKYVLKYADVPEFAELAATVVLLAETEDYKHKVDKPVFLGKEPMPNTWGNYCRWALTPYRVLVACFNFCTLAWVALIAPYSPASAVLVGLALLWLLERVREN